MTHQSSQAYNHSRTNYNTKFLVMVEFMTCQKCPACDMNLSRKKFLSTFWKIFLCRNV